MMHETEIGIALKARSEAEHVFEKAGEHVETLKDKLLEIGRIGAGVVLGNIIYQFATDLPRAIERAVESSASLGRQVYDLQQRIGGSAESVSALLGAFQLFGLNSDEAGQRLIMLSNHIREMEDMTQSGMVSGVGFAGVMRTLGVSVVDADGRFRNMHEILLDTADAFAKMPDGIEKSGDAMAIFGRGGGPFIEFLNQGRQGILDAEAAAKRFGLVLSGENLAALRETEIAHRQLNEAVGGLQVQMSLALEPAIGRLALVMRDWVGWMAANAGPVAERITNTIEVLGIVVESTAQKIAQQGPAVKVLEVALAALAIVNYGMVVPSFIAATVSELAFLATLLLINAPMVLLGAVAAGVALVILANWDMLSQGAQDAAVMISEQWNNLTNWFTTEFWPGITAPARAALETVGNLWSAFWGWFQPLGQAMFSWITDAAGTTWKFFSDVATGALRLVLDAWNATIGVMDPTKIIDVDKAIGHLSGTAQNVMGQVSQAVQDVTDWLTSAVPEGLGKLGDALGRTGEMLGTALEDLGTLKDEIIKQIEDGMDGVRHTMESAGHDAGSQFVTHATAMAQPLVEQLNQMLAQLRAEPSDRALEAAKAEVDRAKLILAGRFTGDYTPEQLQEARITIRQMGRHVLPTLEVGAFDVNRIVKLATDATQTATLQGQIGQNIREQAIAAGLPGGRGVPGMIAPSGGGVGVGPSGPGMEGGGLHGTGPVTHEGASTVPHTAITLHLVVSMEGRDDQIFDELIEANGQAQTPPVIQISAVRRS